MIKSIFARALVEISTCHVNLNPIQLINFSLEIAKVIE